MNPMFLMQAKQRLELFQKEHPKVLPFFNTVKAQALREGTVLELKVTDPDGKEYVSNIRLTANDVETVRMLSEQGR